MQHSQPSTLSSVLAHWRDTPEQRDAVARFAREYEWCMPLDARAWNPARAAVDAVNALVGRPNIEDPAVLHLCAALLVAADDAHRAACAGFGETS